MECSIVVFHVFSPKQKHNSNYEVKYAVTHLKVKMLQRNKLQSGCFSSDKHIKVSMAAVL
jgi:hypothetical protein